MRQRLLSRLAFAHIAAALALGVIALGAATPALAATGSVYYDSLRNVAAGHAFFGGTMPAGRANVGLGYLVMPKLTTGAGNTAIGSSALYWNATGSSNTATGGGALFGNRTGYRNVANGKNALYANTTGNDNVASGRDALYSNNGSDNVASGRDALFSNRTGHDNVATGFQALHDNTTLLFGSAGNFNVATGSKALYKNTIGDDNLALGHKALNANTTGTRNIAVGSGAGQNLTTGSDNVDIANPGLAGESGKIRIGTDANQNAAFLAGVWGKTIAGPTNAVVVNGAGQLGTAPAPASPLKAQTIDRLRGKIREQSAELHQQAAAIKRLQAEVQKGG